MDTQEIINRLRHPTNQNSNPTVQAQQQKIAQETVKKKSKQDIFLLIAAGVVCFMAMVALFTVLETKNRAENVSEELDPSQVEGLTVQEEFNPNQGTTYVQISEGQDRNVAVTNLGTTLPIISRYNYQTLNSENYRVIGTAPWALTTNIAANLDDPDTVRYLLANNDVVQAFLIRDDVSPLLYDYHNVADFVYDTRAMKAFFTDDTVKQVLANEQILLAIMNSRFMSFLLISDSAKYFRSHPQDAADLINASPYLRELQTNPNVIRAVHSNRYLAPIAKTLLTPAAAPAPQQVQTTQPAAQKTNKKTSKKKKAS